MLYKYKIGRETQLTLNSPSPLPINSPYIAELFKNVDFDCAHIYNELKCVSEAHELELE
jgi:hypothetical protein